MKNISLCLVVLILFNSCYSYKQVGSVNPDYLIGKKYEIRIGDRQMEKVIIKEVTDSTLVVIQNKNEITVQKSMITESRMRKYSVPKTILASAVGVLLTLATLGALSWSRGSSSKPIFECC